LNVLFLSSWYPNRTSVNNGNFVARHAQAISKYCNVFVIHITTDDSIDRIEFTEEVINNVTTFIIYIPPCNCKVSLFEKLWKLQKVKKLYFKAFEKLQNRYGKIDLIHANIIFPISIIASALKRKYNIPVIITEHSSRYLLQNQHKLTFIEKYITRKNAKEASVICPVSDNLRSSIESFGIKENFEVIPNCVDEQLFKEKTSRSGKIRLLHISSLSENVKNISGILDSILLLKAIRDDFSMTIVGDANIISTKEMITKLRLDKIVIVKEEKTIEEIAQIMMCHDIFVLFSHYENLPCVIAESHVCGVPVISSDVGGINEMIDVKNGILVPPNNIEIFVDELNNMMNNLSYYNSSEIREKSIERYSYDVVGKQYYQLYKSIIM